MPRKVWIKRLYFDKPTLPRTLVKSDYILIDKQQAEEVVRNTHDARNRAIIFEYAEFYISTYKNSVRLAKYKGARWFYGAVIMTCLYFVGQFIYDKWVK